MFGILLESRSMIKVQSAKCRI